MAERIAEQPRFTATGSAAMWQGPVSTRTPRAVVAPPRPAGPIPSALISARSRASRAADASVDAGVPSGRSNAFLASLPTRIEGSTHTHAHHQRRTGTRRLRRDGIEHEARDPLLACGRVEHGKRARVVRASALEHHVHGRAGSRSKRDIEERGRVVAGVRAVAAERRARRSCAARYRGRRAPRRRPPRRPGHRRGTPPRRVRPTPRRCRCPGTAAPGRLARSRRSRSAVRGPRAPAPTARRPPPAPSLRPRQAGAWRQPRRSRRTPPRR